ncbi:MAG: hypothetical protein EB101_02595 [Chitinophagia bacterium]|nr:hypothetical protein [Chitinophagia bacterium]
MASILKHLRSSTANKRPTASGLADGQIAINTASGTPALFFKDNASNIVKVGPAHVGSTAPNTSPAGSAGNSTGELWVDNGLTTNGLKYYNGTAFVNLTPSGTTSTIGLVELATDAETQAGTDAARAVTPSGLQSKISDSTSTSSSTTIASSTAVKSAYDLANAALPKAGGTITGAVTISPSGSLSFEGSTDDSFETTLAVVDPTADRTITLPNVTGTVVTTGDSGTVTSTMIANDTIVDANINSAAAITLTKLGTGALPTTITVASGNIVDGTISNVEISASAAIADTKLDTISTADKVSLSALNIDGGTDIGAALADADLFIVDDGGGGTNRKAAATRITDYAFGKVSGDITIGSTGTAAISSGVIVNADVNASAAIAGTKISPDFGSQTVQTTGIFSAALGAAATPSIAFTGDTNTGIYSPGADQVAISTNGTGRLFVASTGGVGVGVSNPGYRLDVQDSMNIKIDGSNLARIFFNGTSTRISYNDATGHLSFFTNSTERCYVGYNGAFSIISGGLNVSGGNIALSGGDRSIINNDANALIFGTNGTERMRLDSSGRLGLGTSSPSSLLHLSVATAASDGTKGVRISNPAGTTAVFECGSSNDSYVGTTSASDFSIRTNNTARICVLNGGNVGIGTTAAPGKLTVATTSADPTAGVSAWTDGYSVVSPGGTSTSGGIGFSFNTTANVGHISCATPGTAWRDLIYQALAHRFLSGASEVARINTSGVLLVGQVDTTLNNATGTQIYPTQIVVHSSTSNGTLELGSTRAAVAADIGGQLTFRAVYRNSDSDSVEMAAIRGRRSNATINDWSSYLAFETTNSTTTSERMRLDNAGRLLVGTSSVRSNIYKDAFTNIPTAQFETATNTYNNGLSLLNYSANGYGPVLSLGTSFSNTPGTNTLLVNGGDMGWINFTGNDGTNFRTGASIGALVDGTSGSGDMPGRLVFSTTADGASSPTERMRISNNGDVLFNTTTTNSFFSGGRIFLAGDAQFTRSGSQALTLRRLTNNGDIAVFIPDNGNVVGSISVTSSATAYNTSSDYRLKENVVPLTGAADRLNQLQVHRFNFIADPDRTVDGFIAHEAQAVVPECVTGEKDAVDDDGNPIYQGIDQSKLVPLLTAALQEALAEIKNLKARVTALEP